jgi:PST family polysaccharide transporter/lipopolysaccharide exporter
MTSPPGGDLRQRAMRSLAWQFLGVGGQRVVKVLEIVLLWRVLDEPDVNMGLFIGVLAGIGVIESLTTFVGEQTSIWSDRGTERRYLDTIFTVRVLRSIVISSLLCALAWPMAWWFGTPETEARYWLPGLFLVLAATGLVDALQSPARATHMRGLDFRRVALGDFAATMLGTGTTLLLALLWRDVWAPVVGHIASTALRTIFSHVVAPHRPRFHLDRASVHELFHYNKGAMGTPFLLLMIFTAPAFVLTKTSGGAALAVFDGAGRIAKLPEDLFLRVLGPVAIPAYARLKDDVARLGRAWSGAVHAFLLVGAPMMVALAWCGDTLPAVVFGKKYEPVPGVFALLCLHGGLAGLTAVVGPLFWAIGSPHLDRRAQFWRCVTIYGLGIPGAIWGGVVGFAAASCVAIGIALAASIGYATRHLRLRVSDLAHAARDGLIVGTVLFLLLASLDAMWSPQGWWRVVASAAVSGPLVLLLGLRLHRQPMPDNPAPRATEPENVS